MNPQARVLTVYRASDAEATRELYAELSEHGPDGELAVNLMRACKKSERAKKYTRRFRGASYDGKEWAMGEICRILTEHSDLARWGWGIDEKQEYHKHVLYVDLPNGQVSFHTAARGTGPDYPGVWDGQVERSAGRICSYAAAILEKEIA
jgi:hypothetical protein